MSFLKYYCEIKIQKSGERKKNGQEWSVLQTR